MTPMIRIPPPSRQISDARRCCNTDTPDERGSSRAWRRFGAWTVEISGSFVWQRIGTKGKAAMQAQAEGKTQ